MMIIVGCYYYYFKSHQLMAFLSLQPNITPEFRPKSIASQDSGFISHDYNVPNVSRLIISNKIKGISEVFVCLASFLPFFLSLILFPPPSFYTIVITHSNRFRITDCQFAFWH